MDKQFISYSGLMSRVRPNNEALQVFQNPSLINDMRIRDRLLNGNVTDITRPISSQFSFDTRGQSSEGDSPEDFDFSDEVLKFINHILMEEDVEDKTCMFQESAALQAAEKSFCEVLGEQCPPSSDNHQLQHSLDQSDELPEEKFLEESNFFYDHNDVESFCPDWFYEPNFNGFDGHHVTVDLISQASSRSSYNSSSSNATLIEGPVDSPVKIPDVLGDKESATQFKKGAEEARRFLPSGSSLIMAKYGDWRDREKEVDSISLAVKLEKNFEEESLDTPRGKKNSYQESLGLGEERSSKQSAVYSETMVSADMFDKVLLCSGGKNESALRKELSEVTKSSQQDDALEGSNGGKGRGKKKGSKRSVVDLRTLLTLCAQAVAADDCRTANDFLKQIREHASPTEDGMQRLACYFADGLEARMAGSGYAPVPTLPTSAADFLRAYHILIATCPFRKISNFFANKTFMSVSEKATRLHIIDFGILYGFQWPCFLQRLSMRPGGPPRLRITGIDLPCPGFRPAARVEETGRRLASYAATFGVPFEFNAIAQKWETIKLEDLKIETDELLVVSCLYRGRNLHDETVIVNSPRNVVLNLIRKMNPAVFVQGVVNGAYNAPFFITRFREALFHYSSLYDMLDTIILREIHERLLLERTVFGQEAVNVIACEGAERIERPETYKQWQVRNMRAGFVQLPLDKEMAKMARNRVNQSYHKDFVIDEDGCWLLQGWKGRIIYALSSWRPAY